jgi:hypothetical protein
MSSSLFPQLTTAERDDIGSPNQGQVIWNTDTGTHQTWNGAAWLDLGLGSGGTDDNIFTINQDGDLATAEDCTLELLHGDGGVLHRWHVRAGTSINPASMLVLRKLDEGGLEDDTYVEVGHVDDSGRLAGIRVIGPGGGTEVCTLAMQAVIPGTVRLLAGGWDSAVPFTDAVGQDSPTLLITQSRGAAGDGVTPGGNVGAIAIEGAQGGNGSGATAAGDGADVEIDCGLSGTDLGGGAGNNGMVKLMTKHVDQVLQMGVAANQWNVTIAKGRLGAPGAEVPGPPDTIDMDITIRDQGNASVRAIVECRLFDDAALTTPSNPANHRLTENGAGTVLDGNNTELIEIVTDGNGDATLQVQDVAGASGSTLTVLFRILNFGSEDYLDTGGIQLQTVTFD